MQNEIVRRPDRRRARTRKQFFDALIDLILERGYDTVTIQDIADRADLARATFYLHFADKNDLLMSGLRDIYDAIVAEQPPYTLDDLRDPDSIVISLPAFQQAVEYRRVYRRMMESTSGAEIDRRIRAYLAGHCRAQMEQFVAEAGITRLALPMDVLVEHMASSLMGLINYWLMQGDDSPYSAEDMARMYQRLNAGTWGTVLGL